MMFVKVAVEQMTIPEVDTVSFMVVCEGRLLVERRSLNARVAPGVVAIPGGHVHEGENLVDAVQRELKEETGLNCDSLTLITKKFHPASQENQTVHYYMCNNWVGELECNEADELFWISFEELDILEYEIEREAVAELSKHLSLFP